MNNLKLQYGKCHYFNVGVAQKYGLEESIIIQNLYYWIEKNEANKKHFHDGRYWTYNSIKAFSELFPYWNEKHIARLLSKMEQNGIIITGNFSTDPRDRTKWYALPESVLCIYQKREMESPDLSNGEDRSVPPIPDNKPVNIPVNNIESKENVPDKPVQRSRKFVKPSLDEVKSYCAERNNGIDPEQWYDHYQSNGWMVGKTHMKDWKAAIRTWERRNKNSSNSESHTGNPWGGIK